VKPGYTSWRKSSFSSTAQSDCVEVAFGGGGAAVRDSKAPEAVLTLTPSAFEQFVAGVSGTVGGRT
jgi:hypothetical protein